MLYKVVNFFLKEFLLPDWYSLLLLPIYCLRLNVVMSSWHPYDVNVVMFVGIVHFQKLFWLASQSPTDIHCSCWV